MARVTPKMGLRVWDQVGDIYDHTQMADNWARVDYHDHTPGRGVQIPSDGIEPGAVQTIHLSQEIAVNALMPSGVVLPYGGAGPSPPPGFLFCDGTPYDGTLSQYAKLFEAIGNYYGGTGASDFQVPNMTLKFPLGAGAGHVLGASGGSLTHTHIIPNHTHTGTFTGTASGLSGSVSVTVNGTVDNHSHPLGGGSGAVAVYDNDTVDRFIIEAQHVPGTGFKVASSDDYLQFMGMSTDGASPGFSGSGSGSASGVGGSISTSGTVGSGTNPSGGTLASGNNNQEPPYVVFNYIIKL